MIILKTMRWGNAFSYGDDNSVDFSANPLTQIVGANGFGKSSIKLILEEVLYNKNSKGIKKANVLNRYSKSTKYWIELDFEKDGIQYSVKTVRGTTQTVHLYKDGEDISAHTAPGTYKMVEDIIGYDHKSFCQIVAQSSVSDLEFLTTTDGNRKKFLIDLLGLEKYSRALEVFKKASSSVSEQVASIKAKVSTIQSWMDQYKAFDLNTKNEVPVPPSPTSLVEETVHKKTALKEVDSRNKIVQQNNKYKELLDTTVVSTTSVKPRGNPDQLKAIKASNKTVMDAAEQFITKMTRLGTTCITCGESINKERVDSIIASKREEFDTAKLEYDLAIAELTKYEKELSAWMKQDNARKAYEEYHRLYDPSIPTELLDKGSIEAEIVSIEKQIATVNAQIAAATRKNSEIQQHNAKVSVVKDSMEAMRTDLEIKTKELQEVTARLSNLQILVKAFSPTGLVAYKIECLVKDLEDAINEYLVEISSGRFLLTFVIAGADKLNVVITDNGSDIEISALSNGELARVNISALLGIRKLLQSLSKDRINLLILDETVENLDPEGKEKLVEVLLGEEHLNTFLVSHGFTHPLLEKLTVVKTNNISRIE